MGLFTTVLPSSPVSSTYFGYPMDMDSWNCEQWKQYYIANKNALGKDKAISILNNDGYRVGIFANVHSCVYDCEWSSYMANEGLDASDIFSNTWCALSGVTKNVSKVVVDTSTVASNITGSLKDLTSNKLFVGIAILGVGYYAYKKFEK